MYFQKLNKSYPLGRLEWDGNVKMDLKEINVTVRSWVDSAKDRDFWEPL